VLFGVFLLLVLVWCRFFLPILVDDLLNGVIFAKSAS
jgi:hypothetical protein